MSIIYLSTEKVLTIERIKYVKTKFSAILVEKYVINSLSRYI